MVPKSHGPPSRGVRVRADRGLRLLGHRQRFDGTIAGFLRIAAMLKHVFLYLQVIQTPEDSRTT